VLRSRTFNHVKRAWENAAMSYARVTLASTTALLLLSGAALAQDAVDPNEAQLAFNNHCRTCHVTREGDHRLGPSLHGVIGREAGAASGYPYSPAMANADFVWDAAAIDRFIQNPEALVPGNNMKPFSGVASPEERAKIVAHLQAASDGQ
jgi:cytochrome c